MQPGDDDQEPRTYYLPTTPLTAVNTLLSEMTGWTLTWRQHRNPVTGDRYIRLAVVRITDLTPTNEQRGY